MMRELQQICNKRCGEIIFTTEKSLRFVCLLCDTDYVGSSDYLMHILLAHNIVDLNESDDLDFEKSAVLEITNDNNKGLETFEDQSSHLKSSFRLNEGDSETEERDDDTCSESDSSEASTASDQQKEPKEKYPFKCKICVSKFIKQERLDEHMQTHYETQCLICHQKFATRGDLKYHKGKVHPRNPTYQCSECGATFVTSKGHQLHLLRHGKERNAKCEVCGKLYYVYYIKEHMKTHENLRNFVCSQCGKAFNRSQALRKHMKAHENKREHVCELCGYGFTVVYNLRRHLRLGCKGTTSQRGRTLNYFDSPKKEVKKERNIKCDECGKLFYKTTIKAHMLGHEDPRHLICPLCGKAFSRDASFKSHMMNHDNKRPYVCQLCGFGFNNPSNLKRHSIKCNGTPPAPKKRPLATD